METEEACPTCPDARQLASWKRLARLAADPSQPTIAELLEDASRSRALQLEAGGLLFDFSKQRLSRKVLAELLRLAQERQWRERVADLFQGAPVNSSEGRAALHTALRAPPAWQPPAIGAEVAANLERLKRFAAELAEGRRTGFSGKAFAQVVHIGIGGSELGPRLAVEALQPAGRGLPGTAPRPPAPPRLVEASQPASRGLPGTAPRPPAPPRLVEASQPASRGLPGATPRLPASPRRMEALQPAGRGLPVRFVANVDGHALVQALDGLDPETTLFIVVSKSFATLETRLNAQSARRWFLERTRSPQALARHFIAVTANAQAAVDFGLPQQSVFPIWDWVGGRFSLWSAAGLSIALALGGEAFDALLAGAHAMDQHFQEAPAAANAPLLAALIGVWNGNFLGATSQAVLPYDERLRLLPDYLQQLETESNGKRVRRDGAPLEIHSTPILWGGVGSTGQHAFHQWLHQGTHGCAVDFILTGAAEHDLPEHHRWLLANGLSQAKALAFGAEHADPHRAIPGNRPSTTIVLDRLDPARLGALLAFYEHRTFCQGLIWDLNSFDQWGVELGKRLAETLFEQLGGAAAEDQDASTRALIERLRERAPATESGE